MAWYAFVIQVEEAKVVEGNYHDKHQPPGTFWALVLKTLHEPSSTHLKQFFLFRISWMLVSCPTL